MKLGSLFSGAGLLDLAVEEVFGARTVWVSDIEPGPRKVLAHRFPGVPNLGDITAVDWSKVEPVDIIAGGSPCFPAGTLVDTIHGYRPIETISDGDLVLTHRGRYMPVVQTMQRDATDAIRLNVQGVPEFVTTAEHPFYVRHRTKVWDNSIRRYTWQWADPQWVSASHLTKDHFVGYQVDQPSEPPIGPDLAYLIGRWLGDGWVRNGKRASRVPQGQRGSRVASRWHQVFICCAHDEADELAQAICAAGFNAARLDERTVTKFRINSKSLVTMLRDFGRGAAGKQIPGWVFRLPVDEQHALWTGWMDADGSVKATTGQQRATTISERLAHGMARVGRNVFRRAVSLHRCGVAPTTLIEGREVRQRTQFQVCLSESNRDAIADGDWIWAPVRAVSPALDCRVFNIGVQEDESYTAWGITVHNCQDISAAGRMAGMVHGSRSNLWVHMREAIRIIRPMFVVWENVGAARSTKAASASLPDHLENAIRHHQNVAQETRHAPARTRHQRAAARLMERRQGLVGDHPAGVPVLRALGRVLGDLANLGFDAEWHGLLAGCKRHSVGTCSECVGAPHGRARFFVVAAHPERVARGEWRFATAGQAAGVRPLGAAPRRDRAPITLLPTPKTTDDRAHSEGDIRRNDPGLRSLPSLLPTPSAGNFNAGEDPDQWEARRQRVKETANNGNGMGMPLGIADQLLPTPRATRGGSSTETVQLLPTPMAADSRNGRQSTAANPRCNYDTLSDTANKGDWGRYAAAIARWEAIVGPAPAPTKPGRNGRPKLNPAFAEWMMGAPAGWITNTPRVTDTEAVRMAGNGVVRQQAVAALRLMLNRMETHGAETRSPCPCQKRDQP